MGSIILTDDPKPTDGYEDAQAVRKPSGAILVAVGGGEQWQHVADTVRCVHCQRHFVMRKGSGKQRGFCFKCNGIFCGAACAPCVPFEKKLDVAEARG